MQLYNHYREASEQSKTCLEYFIMLTKITTTTLTKITEIYIQLYHVGQIIPTWMWHKKSVSMRLLLLYAFRWCESFIIKLFSELLNIRRRLFLMIFYHFCSFEFCRKQKNYNMNRIVWLQNPSLLVICNLSFASLF